MESAWCTERDPCGPTRRAEVPQRRAREGTRHKLRRAHVKRGCRSGKSRSRPRWERARRRWRPESTSTRQAPWSAPQQPESSSTFSFSSLPQPVRPRRPLPQPRPCASSPQGRRPPPPRGSPHHRQQHDGPPCGPSSPLWRPSAPPRTAAASPSNRSPCGWPAL